MKITYHNRLLVFVLMLLLFTAVAVSGQEATPDQPINPEEVVQQYLETGDPNLLAEDVQFADPWSAQPIVGRDAVGMLGDNYYGLAYNLDLVPWRYLQTDEGVIVEFQYRDPDTAPVAVATSDFDQDIPMIGIYQVRDGEITSARAYYSALTLQTQMGVVGAPGVAPGAPMAGSVAAQEFAIILNDPTSFYGEEVTVEGMVGRAINDRAFVLHQFDVVATAGDGELLVIDGTQDGLDFIQLADAMVRIEGTLQSFNATEMETDVGFALSDEDFAGYQDQPVLVATSAVNIDDVATLSNLVEDPQAFYGQSITVDGNIGRAVSDRAFVLYQGGLGGGNEVLVVRDSLDAMDFIQLADAYVRVHGTVSAFNVMEVENEIGDDLDDTVFAEFENTPVILASSITNLDQVSTIPNILDHPEAFYGHSVTLEGVLSDVISEQAAFLEEDAILNVRRVLLVGASGDVVNFTQEGDQRVSVTGTVRQFLQADIQNEYGLAPADNVYADYEGQPVIIVDQVNPIE